MRFRMEFKKICSLFILLFCCLPGDATNDTDPDFQPRIIGGQIAHPTQAPYHVLLRRNGEYICGGAFIEVDGTQIILTAASCVEDRNGYYDIVACTRRRFDFEGSAQIRPVYDIIRHHGYNPIESPSKDDIAVLKLNGRLYRNSFVQPINLPRMWQPTLGDGWVAGWGRTSNWGGLSDQLRILRVPILPGTVCRHSRRSQAVRIYDSMICAGYDTGNSGAPCLGDYGSPLKADNGNYLAGIFSNAWHTDCQNRRNFPVFTKVSYYVDWIEDCVAGYC